MCWSKCGFLGDGGGFREAFVFGGEDITIKSATV